MGETVKDAMGFYLDLQPVENEPSCFREVPPPLTFWALYGLASLALFGMAFAAHQIVGDLFRQATLWDWWLLGLALLILAIFLWAGVKMLALRKFIRSSGPLLELGFFVFGWPLCIWRIHSQEVKEIGVVNQRPAPNLAPQFHDDPQYYVKGHWRLVVRSLAGKTRVLDKHVEKEALAPLLVWTTDWWKKNTH